MPYTPTGRTAIVTGGSGGIGGAISMRLAQDGVSVVVHYAGNPDRARQIVDEIISRGGRAAAASGDIGDQTQMTSVFDFAEAEFDGIDVVVNTAGRMPLAPIAEMSIDTFDELVRTNLRGTFVTSQLAAQRVRPGGAIINFSSSVTRIQPPTYGPYAATKGGVEAFSLILARELRGKDVTVNVVAPGPTETPLFTEGKSDEQIQQIAGMNPMQRLGQPGDIAEVVAALAGPVRWVNGQTLFVNGGAA